MNQGHLKIVKQEMGLLNIAVVKGGSGRREEKKKEISVSEMLDYTKIKKCFTWYP